MLKLIMKYLLLLLLSLSANSSDKEVAISKSMEAVQSYPIVKTAIDVQTKRIIKMIEMDEDFLKNLAIITYISQTNKISTEKIGNIRYNFEYGYIRPDFYYNYYNNEKGGSLVYKWSFK